jgi:hypothetical protein
MMREANQLQLKQSSLNCVRIFMRVASCQWMVRWEAIQDMMNWEVCCISFNFDAGGGALLWLRVVVALSGGGQCRDDLKTGRPFCLPLSAILLMTLMSIHISPLLPRHIKCTNNLVMSAQVVLLDNSHVGKSSLVTRFEEGYYHGSSVYLNNRDKEK